MSLQRHFQLGNVSDRFPGDPCEDPAGSLPAHVIRLIKDKMVKS